MSQEQIELITVDTLRDKTLALRQKGNRLVQISATRMSDQTELTYSFDLDDRLANLRLSLPIGAHLPSISAIYGCAVLYENEIHDLFGVTVDDLALDFHGNFYKTAIKFPFASNVAPCASSAATPAACATAPAARTETTK